MNFIFSKFFKIFVFILVFISQSYAKDYELMDRIIVTAEKSVVTQNELSKALKKNNINKEQLTSAEFIKIKKEILKSLIEKKLIIQYSEKLKIEPSSQEVEMIFNNIALNNKISKEDLEKELLNNEINVQEFKEDLKYQLTVQKIKDREIMPFVNVSEFEIDAWLKSKDNKLKYNLQHILIKSEKTNTEKILEKIYSEPEKENFSELAQLYSDGPNADKGGSLGSLEIEEMPEIFIEEVKKLKIGELSKPIKSPNGIHILKLVNIEGSSYEKKLTQREYKFQQILLKKNTIKTDLDIEKRLLNIKNQIDNGLPFSEAVKQYSEEQFNNDENNLEWVALNKLIPEFGEHLNKFPEKKIIGPFKTDLGWHLLKVFDLQDRDITKDAIKQNARIQIARKKTEIRYLDWLDALVKNSNVNYFEVVL